jgi:hypothetical protein
MDGVGLKMSWLNRTRTFGIWEDRKRYCVRVDLCRGEDDYCD